ncbi:MAG: AAA family ATPase [Gemmatimonadales bacterium]|nr:AAA family ATPase [Gemmatimonadales bacterium]NIN10741.1 AAA family ATPase [Gemmatimonadales bacterium]NIQ98971.1 AAA family ATPase [Gemmatimonadales bacterium]NIS63790.1 AAA family ATPase [Gemmatimonadales bacterium]
MRARRRVRRDSLTNLVHQVDTLPPGEAAPDTVPTRFPSLDRVLGGGFRRRDLVVLGGDVGSGKSALALAIALRSADAGHRVAFFSGEMDEDRLMERALALEARVEVDSVRSATLNERERAAIGAAALRLRDLPLSVFPLVGQQFDDALAAAWADDPALVVVDYVQLLPPPSPRLTQDEDTAAAVRALKALALDRQVACLAVAQLPRHVAKRDDPRPSLDDFGILGAVKQHADIVLGVYREEMYNPGGGVEGATELIVAKNRNGPTGFIDLYFYQHWLRFEDMLDPER